MTTDMPSRFEPDAERADRIAYGVALCRQVLAAARARATQSRNNETLTGGSDAVDD